jgi:Tubulin like
MNTIFVIGIGGTGMKCLESFVHLCAMGMFDNHEIHILALDTDIQNGNFRQLQAIVERYNIIKGQNKAASTADSFFTAKIALYKFSPDYNTTQTNSLRNISNLSFADQTTKDLANAFFSNDVQEFNLEHGYRAQTHLGSMLMYHALVENGTNNNDLQSFVDKLRNVIDPCVFVMGSVFGGTGASSLPIIPLALNKLCGDAQILRTAKFGATLLSNYFTFSGANDNQKMREKIIANADNFAINSQAALMFYNKDNTVRNTYKYFYLLGVDGNTLPMDVTTNQQQVITGGGAQKNNAHYIELMAAGAAFDFFMSKSKNENHDRIAAPLYLYHEIDDNLKFDFRDVINSDEFIKKCTLFTALSFYSNLEDTNFFEKVQSGKVKNVNTYTQMDIRQVHALKEYLSYYHFKIENGQEQNGWLRNVHQSTGGSDHLFYSAKMYSENLRKFGFNELFDNRDYIKHNMNIGWGLLSSASARAYNNFEDKFRTLSEPTDVQNTAERLIKRSFNALKELHNF